ncbi:MAG TPA: PEP-CTERM sorting domain-containing protein [Terriglobales bacterium]|jgi:hypothetical protein
MKPLTAFACELICLLAVTPAAGQTDLYDNGPTNGTIIAWTINFGNAVSDTFTLNSNSTVNGLTFAAWLFPGDVLETVEVAITSSEFGGTTYFDQTVSFTAGTCFSNGGFNVCNETGSFPGVSMNAGTYWLNLENAVVNNGDPVYWDENNGPSLSSETISGSIGSESFTILGSSGTSTGTTPEPSSIILFASGAIAVFGFIRHKYPA